MTRFEARHISSTRRPSVTYVFVCACARSFAVAAEEEEGQNQTIRLGFYPARQTELLSRTKKIC